MSARKLEVGFSWTGALAGDSPAIRRVLVPVHSPRQASQALQAATGVCRDTNAVLRLVHVRVYDPPIARSPRPLYQESAANTGAMLGEALVAVWRNGARASTAVIDAPRGGEADAIACYASAWHADLIVLTRRPRPALARLLRHSVTNQIKRKANCPVLAVHQRPSDAGQLQAPTPIPPTDAAGTAHRQPGVPVVKRTQAMASAERGEQAHRALAAQMSAERDAARAGWTPALDPDWLRQSDLFQVAAAWGAAMPYADRSVPWYEPAATTAMRKSEQRLRDLHRHAMARYDRLRADGMPPAQAMRETAPFFTGAPRSCDTASRRPYCWTTPTPSCPPSWKPSSTSSPKSPTGS
jgi:nucleotide-binding universal stress UspA family protein